MPEHDDFDRDITEDFQFTEDPFSAMSNDLYMTFNALCEAGFSENQALKFMAFCSVFMGEVS